MTAIEQINVDESSKKAPCTFLSSFQKQPIMVKFVILLAVLALVGSAAAFSMTMSSSSDRRSFVRTAGTAGAAALIQSSPANAVLAEPTTEVDTSDFIESESGLKYKVLKEGTGAIPADGQTVKVSSKNQQSHSFIRFGGIGVIQHLIMRSNEFFVRWCLMQRVHIS
jgi:hypothetical protein